MTAIRASQLAVAVAALAPATARAGVHPRFEPTDLELELPGVMEVDLQAGPVKGPDAARIVVPDFEIDLGLLPNLELDVDGAYGVEGAGPVHFLDHSAPENLWLSAKVGLYDHHDAKHDRSWAIGAQLGPKLPIATDTHGIGAEGLILIGYMRGSLHLVGQIGGLVDPHSGSAPRPVGPEAGLDLEYELVPDRWSILGELGGIWYHSDDPAQLSATLGIQFSPTDKLDLSIVGLVGFLPGSDPYGLLFGVSPKFSLW